MSRVLADKLTSTGFVSYVFEVSHTLESWDDAELAFPGRARWDLPTPEAPMHTDEEREPQVA